MTPSIGVMLEGFIIVRHLQYELGLALGRL